MSDKTDEQIVIEIEVHSSNAITLLKKSQEIKRSALDMHNLDDYNAAIKRAVDFQKLSMDEMQKAVNLLNTFTSRYYNTENSCFCF